jgi:hypothetical protein
MAETRKVKVVLSDLELEAKEAELEAAVVTEVLCEQKLTDISEKYKAAKDAAKGASAEVRRLTREVYQRECRKPVECSWRYHEDTGRMHLHRNDTGAEVEGEKTREATTEEKTLTLFAEDLKAAVEPPVVRVLALPPGEQPTAKEKLRRFFAGSAGGFDLDTLTTVTGINRNTLRRVLPELCEAGELRRDEEGCYWLVSAEEAGNDNENDQGDESEAAE